MIKKATLLAIVLGFFLTASAQQTGSFSKNVTYNGASYTYSYYVPPTYTAGTPHKLLIGLFGLGDNADNYRNVLLNNVSGVQSSPLYKCIVIVPSAGSDKAFGTPDTGMITIILNDAFTNYNIDKQNVYINGFSYGGRQALQYGLIHYKKFKGIEVWTPAAQTQAEAQNQNSAFKFKFENSKYIPVCMSVGDQDQGYNIYIPIMYTAMSDSGGMVNLQLLKGVGHTTPSQSLMFQCFNYLNTNAVTGTSPDASVSAINVPFMEECNSSLTPEVVLQNKSSTNLTSATINYQIDGGTNNTYSWTGNLIQNQKAKVKLPAQNVAAGTHTLVATAANPNGGADAVSTNDSKSASFTYILKGAGTLNEGFESSTFPPVGWKLYNKKSLAWTWQRKSSSSSGGFGQSAGSMYFDNGFPYVPLRRDEIWTARYDFTWVTTPSLVFDVAYAPFQSGGNTAIDSLTIFASTDCGATWQRIYQKGGTTLSTTGGYVSTTFSPTANQWRKETISLSQFAGQSKVMFSFRNISGWGNPIFIDNINLTGVTGLSEEQDLDDFVQVYPNPNNGTFHVTYQAFKTSDVTIEVSNALGQIIYTELLSNFNGEYQKDFDVQNYGAGLYFVTVQGEVGRTVKKIIVTE